MRNMVSAITVLLVFLVSCTRDYVTETYTFFRPVYHTKDEVKAAIKSAPAEAIVHPGKLFVKGNYVFLNDINRGVHIINFSNPSAPENLAFVNIPGNVDIAVRGNYLYADCYTDLVSIDISDPQNVKLAGFSEGVFPQRIYDSGFYPDSSKVITDWVRVDTVFKRRYERTSGWQQIFLSDINALSSADYSSQFSPNKSTVNGTGGSMARFALNNNRMYTVSYNDLKIFNTANPAVPVYVGTVNIPQGLIETIFPYEDKLFLGSQTGMFIYSLASPDAPQQLAQFGHVRTCDPVIADGQYAYVTLSGGSSCGGFTNQMDVLDISNIVSPQLVKSYPLTGPTGLSKDGNVLMVCDGDAGLKFMNAADPMNITVTATLTGIVPYDVIALGGTALTVAKDGIYFINYSNPAQPVVSGKLTVVN